MKFIVLGAAMALATPVESAVMTLDLRGADEAFGTYEFVEDGMVVRDLSGAGFAAEQGLHLDFALGPYASAVSFETVSGGTFSPDSIDISPLGNGYISETLVFDPDTYEYDTVYEEVVWDDGLFLGYMNDVLVAESAARFATAEADYTYRFGAEFAGIDRLELLAPLDNLPEPETDDTDIYVIDDHHALFSNFVYSFAPTPMLPAPVPLPAAGTMLLFGLGTLGVLRRR